jgi:hypothetical protein
VEGDRLFDALARRAASSVRRPPPAGEVGARVLLDAVFLVSRTARARFEAGIAQAAKRLSDRGFALALTGPWPPYHFVMDGR